MLKYAVLFTTAFCLVQSQRPWHAGTNNNRLPQVLPQYIDERIAAQQGAQAAQAGQANPAGQVGIAGQPGQAGQVGLANQPGQVGITNQPGQFGQAGQVGLANQPGQVGITNQPGQFGQAGQVGQEVQTSQGTPAAGANGVVDESVGNRISAGDANAAAPALGTTQGIPFDLPVDAHGDIDLVNRIMTWPRDKQPFWFINWQAIQAHRGDVNNTAQPAQTQPNSRSFFAG